MIRDWLNLKVWNREHGGTTYMEVDYVIGAFLTTGKVRALNPSIVQGLTVSTYHSWSILINRKIFTHFKLEIYFTFMNYVQILSILIWESEAESQAQKRRVDKNLSLCGTHITFGQYNFSDNIIIWIIWLSIQVLSVISPKYLLNFNWSLSHHNYYQLTIKPLFWKNVIL